MCTLTNYRLKTTPQNSEFKQCNACITFTTRLSIQEPVKTALHRHSQPQVGIRVFCQADLLLFGTNMFVKVFRGERTGTYNRTIRCKRIPWSKIKTEKWSQTEEQQNLTIQVSTREQEQQHGEKDTGEHRVHKGGTGATHEGRQHRRGWDRGRKCRDTQITHGKPSK